MKKRIFLIATGGTIASKKSENGLTPVLLSDELLSYVSSYKEFCDVDTIQLFNLDSTNVGPKHWIIIANCIKEHYDAYDGFVICHGTDTMAYTSAALTYLIQNSAKPIVVTGAQKPINLDITDARLNILDSLRYASCEDAHGITIVFDGKVIDGTRGKKIRSKSYNAFTSINYPYIAIIQDERIVHYVKVKSTQVAPTFYDDLDDRVFLLKLIPGINADIFSYLESRYEAVIIESFGVGGIPTNEDNDFYHALDRFIKNGKVVVMTTQVQQEGSDMTIYQVGHDVKKNLGLIEAYDMTLEAAVAKTMWILGQTTDVNEVKKMFYQPVQNDILFF
ncbi:MAG: L-asparaginase, type [Herbinix sp.]|jgi:L-asparaginase|nr:L-asparaginase, type [Herbinix sp.]